MEAAYLDLGHVTHTCDRAAVRRPLMRGRDCRGMPWKCACAAAHASVLINVRNGTLEMRKDNENTVTGRYSAAGATPAKFNMVRPMSHGGTIKTKPSIIAGNMKRRVLVKTEINFVIEFDAVQKLLETV